MLLYKIQRCCMLHDQEISELSTPTIQNHEIIQQLKLDFIGLSCWAPLNLVLSRSSRLIRAGTAGFAWPRDVWQPPLPISSQYGRAAVEAHRSATHQGQQAARIHVPWTRHENIWYGKEREHHLMSWLQLNMSNAIAAKCDRCFSWKIKTTILEVCHKKNQITRATNTKKVGVPVSRNFLVMWL